jgi:hypothetical protein
MRLQYLYSVLIYQHYLPAEPYIEKMETKWPQTPIFSGGINGGLFSFDAYFLTFAICPTLLERLVTAE